MPTDQQLSQLSWPKVARQATCAEFVAMLVALDYLETDPGNVPSDLRGAGILDFLYWNDNAHSALDGASYTSLLQDPDNNATKLKAAVVWSELATAFAADKAGFLTTHFSAARGEAIANDQPTTGTDDTAKTHKALTWSATGQTTPDLIVMAPYPRWSTTEITLTGTPTTTSITASAATNADVGSIIYWHDQASGARYQMWSQVSAKLGNTLTLSPALPLTPSSGDKVVFNSAVGAVKTALDALPAGYKSLLVAGNSSYLPMRNAAGFTYACYDDHFASTTTSGIGTGGSPFANRQAAPVLDVWESLLPPMMTAWRAALESAGATVDWWVLNTFMDFVDSGFFWSSSAVNETVLVANATVKAAIEAEVGFDLDDFDALQPNFMTTALQESMRYNSMKMNRYGESLGTLCTALTTGSSAKSFDYHACRQAPSVYWLTPSFSERPGMFAGIAPGTHSSDNAYGAVNFPYDDSATAYDAGPAGQSWTMPNMTGLDTDTDLAKWAGLTCSVMNLRSMFCASALPLAPWVPFEEYNATDKTASAGTLYDSPLYQELVFHALLHGGQLACWNGDGATNDDLPLQAALTEANQAIGFETLLPASYDVLDFDQDYIATCADVGGRFVYRVTYNPNIAAPSITETSDGIYLAFVNDTLFIRGGRVANDFASSYTTSGAWIYADGSESLDSGATGELYGYGSRAIGTSATQIVPTPTRDWPRYLLVAAHPDNTANVYLGSSASVSATKTDAACGFVLEPGDVRRFPLAKHADGFDETHVWGIAASSQYVTWEVH